MLVNNAERELRVLVGEYLHVAGSSCIKEIELKARLEGFRKGLALAKLVTDARFQEIFAAVHLEIFGMTSGAKSLAIGVAGQQLTMKDWEKFDVPTVVRRGQPRRL